MFTSLLLFALKADTVIAEQTKQRPPDFADQSNFIIEKLKSVIGELKKNGKSSNHKCSIWSTSVNNQLRNSDLINNTSDIAYNSNNTYIIGLQSGLRPSF